MDERNLASAMTAEYIQLKPMQEPWGAEGRRAVCGGVVVSFRRAPSPIRTGSSLDPS